MNRFLLLLFFFSTITAISPAEARVRRDADMFRDTTWSSYGRPFVMSDLPRGQDMFRSVPLMFNPNADMFDHVKERPISLRGEMLVLRPRPMPYSRIFTNDHWTN